MIQPCTPESSPAAERPAQALRVKKSTGMIVLLAYLTLSNAVGLLLGIILWADWSDHGSRYDVIELQAAVFTTVVSLVALVALGGAWSTRIWGPRVYVCVAVFGLVIGLVITEGAFSPLSLVGIALAVWLWRNAETNW